MAEDVRTRYAKLFTRGDNTERIMFFSDAVFAIAMTLLVLEIRLPEVESAELGPALAALWPSYFGYVLSFGIIGINWFTHHRKFTVIERYDTRLIWINLVLLLVVAFLPFPTSVLAEYGPQTPAVVLYAATVGMLSVLQLLLWVHARRGGLLAASVDGGIYRHVRFNLLPLPIVFGLSIPIAFVSPEWAMYFWILLAPVSIVLGRIADRRDVDEEPPATPRPRRSRGSAS
jgi:uncharacterized membrane protein